MDKFSDTILSLPTARWIAKDLAIRQNVEVHLSCLWFTTITVEILEKSGLEKAVARCLGGPDCKPRTKAAWALRRFAFIREQAEKEEEVPVQKTTKTSSGMKRKTEDKVEEEPRAKIARVEDKEHQKKAVAELAKKIKELPAKPSPFDAMKLLRSVGEYSAALMEEAEALIGRKMRRADEVWRLMLFIKFGDYKGTEKKDIRALFYELQKKQNEAELFKKN